VLHRGLQTGEEPMPVSVEYKLGPLSRGWEAEASGTDFGGGDPSALSLRLARNGPY
jgi:hypothetical protein